ncbi:MAG: dihydrolipoyllysine-residue acetyltransferase [Steroidobacteraceae bacterium]|jgi:pyruvate dehydrogenase E2 component (dihydrolipoamide acetyltransferase)
MASTTQVLVPDIGGFKDVEVIDVLVKAGQQIDKETPMITLETEKAAMDVPAPAAGRIAELKVKKGDKVSEGSVILLLEGAAQSAAAPDKAPAPKDAAVPGASKDTSTEETPAENTSSGAATESTRPQAAAPQGSAPPRAAAPGGAPPIDEKAFSTAYASPSVRKFARELGVDLGQVKGTGPKGRITHEDVKAYVKRLLSAPPAAPAGGLPKVPEVDFALFGPVESQPLSRIQIISGARLQASWVNLPHVTQHEDADITDMDIARVALKPKATQEGVRLTPLAFIIRACIVALKEFPRFNASLDASGKNLVLKKYFHIGFAADTPNGLLVPVIRDADRLNLFDLARALATLSDKARAGKLSAAEMQGGSFTVSSLGGIGGTAFTPIINAPEVAILGVSRSVHKPVFANGTFVPRLMLPLSLSYDHRVIDGAQAARFVVFLSQTLGDVKALL